jgi:Tol biopolymer transport system component
MRSRLLLVTFFLPFLSLTAYPGGEPKKAEPVNLTCNTDGDEVDPHVAGDGKTLYYSCKPKDSKRFSFYAARRATTAANWGEGKLIDEPSVCSKDPKGQDRGLSMLEGGGRQYLFFASKKDSDPLAGFDIYAAYKEKDGRDRVFTAVTPVRNVSEKEDEMHPWLSADGRALYFSRKLKEGWRVFVGRRTEASGLQGFDKVTMIESIPVDFKCATTTPDGKTMYLEGPLANDKIGLHVSKWNGKEWDKPAPLDMLNDPEAKTGDMSPCLTRDGTKLYFASDRPGGKGRLDLWVVPVMQLAK